MNALALASSADLYENLELEGEEEMDENFGDCKEGEESKNSAEVKNTSFARNKALVGRDSRRGSSSRPQNNQRQWNGPPPSYGPPPQRYHHQQYGPPPGQYYPPPPYQGGYPPPPPYAYPQNEAAMRYQTRQENYKRAMHQEKYAMCTFCQRWMLRNEMQGINVRIYHDGGQDEKIRMRFCPACHEEWVEDIRANRWENDLRDRGEIPEGGEFVEES